MRIETEIKLDFKDVLIRPKRSTLRSRSEVSLERTFTFKHSKRTWTGVPIMVSNMDSTGTFEMVLAATKFKIITCLHKHYSPQEICTFLQNNKHVCNYIALSAGTSDEDFENIKAVMDSQKITVTNPAERLNFICLDVANGYSETFIQAVRRYRAAFPDATLIAGNVVTGEMTEELILSGADIVKIGIGPGSVCTTRIQTGVGYPQLSAIIECADASHGLGGLVIGDGGLTNPGDFAKAFGAGADFAMSGGLFAGHDESGGEIVERNGNKYKLFYGMSSTTAMEKHHGKVAEYRSSEGKTVEVPYRGPVQGTILDILGGLRSSCTYVGASSIKEMSKRTTFIRVTQQANPVFNEHKTDSRLPISYFQNQTSTSNNSSPIATTTTTTTTSSSNTGGEGNGDQSINKRQRMA
jgi:GMP reductase